MPAIEESLCQSFSQLGSEFISLIEAADLPGLGEEPKNANLKTALLNHQESDWPSIPPSSQTLVLSALWLLAGELDRSHTISQDLPCATGSYLHGIMHRREGDFGNAKYWFRKVGDHPVIAQLQNDSSIDYDDPFGFVDQCSEAFSSNGPAARKCIELQWSELSKLITFCLSTSDR